MGVRLQCLSYRDNHLKVILEASPKNPRFMNFADP